MMKMECGNDTMRLQTAMVPFRGTSIPTAQIGGQVHVVMKPVCEAIGLPWEGQRQRIRRHPVLKPWTSVMLVQLPGDRQAREHLTLPLGYLNGWLFTASADRARPEIRERLVAYQHECFFALDAYWRRGFAANPRLRTIADAERPDDGRDKSRGTRFAEERAKFEAREGITFVKAIRGLGVLSPAKLRAIEQRDTEIDDKLHRWLVAYGFDLHYILYGKRLLTEAERAVRDVMRMADDDDRAAIIAFAETVELDVIERHDAYGELVFMTDRHGTIIDQHAGRLLN